MFVNKGILKSFRDYFKLQQPKQYIPVISSLLFLHSYKRLFQERARAEVNAIMEENGGKLTMSGLQSLSYLERCIKESLRLYPSVPFISRLPETEVKLSNYRVL